MRSGLGCGTRFTLWVPLAPGQRPRSPLENAEIQVMNEFEYPHVLVVEDDALGSAALKGLLSSWGCQ